MAKIVCTTLGNSIIQEGKQVFVHVAGNRFVQKNVEDLNVGDQVVYNKEFVTTSLEELDPILDRSPRYRHAQQLLHETNGQGVIIPKQRTFLIRGLAQRGIVQEPDLEARVLKEVAPDFSAEQYTAMNEEVFRAVNPNYAPETRENRNRTHSAINQWLKGDTVAIHVNDWSLYRFLDPLNPEFRRFQPEDPSREGFFWNYRLYTTVRRTIKRYLAECKGGHRSREEPEAERDREHISITPEIQLVVNYFINDIDAQYAAARVTAINPVEGGPSPSHPRPAPNLSSGIVNKSREEGGISIRGDDGSSSPIETMSMVDIATHYSIISGSLKTAFIQSAAQSILTHISSYSPGDAERAAMTFAAGLYNIFDSRGKLQESFFKSRSETLTNPQKNEQFKKMLADVESSAFNGAIDLSVGWPNGTFSSLLERACKLRTILPSAYVDYIELYNAYILREDNIVKGNAAEFQESARRQFFQTHDKIRKYGFKQNSPLVFQLNLLPFSMVSNLTNYGSELFSAVVADRMKSGKIPLEKDPLVSKFHYITKLNIFRIIAEDMQREPSLYLPVLKEHIRTGNYIWTKKEARDMLESYDLPPTLIGDSAGIWIPVPELDEAYGRMKEEARLERMTKEAEARKPKPRETYRFSDGREIFLDTLPEKERRVYVSLTKAKIKGGIKGVYESQVQQVYDIPSKNKLQRKLDSLKQSSLFRIYQDMQSAADKGSDAGRN